MECTNCVNYTPVDSETHWVKSAYSIGDEFWQILGNKPRLLVISKIRAEITAEDIKIYYNFKLKDTGITYFYDVEESKIKNKYFKTKQELIDSL